jgi:hypothetical protein
MSLNQVIHDTILNNFRSLDPATDPALPGSGATYVHMQATAHVTWVATHELGTKSLDMEDLGATGKLVYVAPDYGGA